MSNREEICSPSGELRGAEVRGEAPECTNSASGRRDKVLTEGQFEHRETTAAAREHMRHIYCVHGGDT